MSLSFSTDSEFIKKLSRVVEENLADENFGVKELAQKTKLSRTQLHRKLKSINNQSVSQFIREIRLNKAKEMLQQDIGTVSEIAFKVGFGSPSYFIKCFKEYFGYPPGVLLKLPPEDGEKENEVSHQNHVDLSSSSVKDNKGIPLKPLIAVLGVLIIVTIVFFVLKDIKNKNALVGEDKTIAVLPLKNLSDDKDIQYLAGGIMEDILNRLSHVEELKVKSRISSERYDQAESSIPEIAKEMNVSYVLEGSIINQDDKVRIYVQLIEAKTDNHLWSKEYNQDLTNILDFTSDVSKQIAEELQVALTRDEIQKIEKNYTENKEAYNLYLLGRHLWHRKTKSDVLACVEYYKKAIQLDSTYSLAYAGLADAYNTLGGMGWMPFEEGINKCKEYALKAIDLDYTLAEGHASLGDCASDYLFDWDLAEKELKLAIQLNPNFALAYRYYADYLIIMGRNKEAKKNLDISLELDPLSMTTYGSYASLYFNEGKFDEMLKMYEISGQSQESSQQWHFITFKARLLQHRDEEAFEALKQFISLRPAYVDYTETLNKLFAESGMNGVMEWLIDYFKKNIPDNYQLAAFYTYLGDKEKAIDYLEKVFNIKERRHSMTLIKSDYDYRSLHGHPRFTALLEKMDLADR